MVVEFELQIKPVKYARVVEKKLHNADLWDRYTQALFQTIDKTINVRPAERKSAVGPHLAPIDFGISDIKIN